MESDPDKMVGISSRVPKGAQDALLELAKLHGALKNTKDGPKPCLTTLLRMLSAGSIQTILCFEPATVSNPYPYSRGKIKHAKEKSN